uniref:cardiomyopathy-associated protein 5 n=1 Tax=Centroberyx gerrardi TaxID=166262 RepID=UPI003AAFAFCC
MEECESLDSEMTELQECQSEASEAIGQDDEDEVEELRNSLREVVQDQSVKPKLQCLMVDPSFSMVTVQSEDSGIVWETASSRCSTPWASETSSISEAYSMEGSGAQGKITIVFDEEKIIRRRTRSGGRISRLGDRLSRPGSSRSSSALGVERPEMAEVSVPNVKQEKTETGPDLEEIKDKDQQLFSLISEGYEILNIRVPSKLPTVDEEESTELEDNLSYLNQTPRIRSKNHHGSAQRQNDGLPGEVEVEILENQEALKQDSSQPLANTEVGHTHTQKDSASDMDYFEKFTLLDEVVPGEQAPEPQEEVEQPAAKSQAEEQKPVKETATDSPSASEDSFVFVTDVEIAGEHLDEVFYGNGVHGAPAHALQRREDEELELGGGKRMRRESQRSLKESGSVLFTSEETTLTPIFLSPGPPKIIDPILLEEPTAMSFMYSDLYEDAMGERRKSDEEYSEAESVAPERLFKRRLSDSEEADGYLEMFILKDETPTVEVQPDSQEDKRVGRMMWSQSKFELTGCLTRVVEEEEGEGAKKKEPKTQEVSAAEMSGHVQSAKFEEKEEIIETEKMEDQELKQEIKTDQTEPVTVPETQQVDTKIEKTEERKEHQREEPAEKMSEPDITELQQTSQTQKVMEKTAKVVVKATEETPAEVKAPVSSEVPQMVVKPAAQTDIEVEAQVPAKIGGTENTEKSLSEEAALDTKIVAADQKVEKVNEMIVAEAEAPAKVKEPEIVREETVACAEPSVEAEISTEVPVGGKTEAVVPEKAAPVITDSEPTVQAVVEVTEKAVGEAKIQTQVQIALQEVTSAETPEVQMLVPEEQKEAVGTDQESEVKTETSPKVIEPLMPEEVKPDADEKHLEVPEPDQSQQEESVTGKEWDKIELTAEIKAKTSVDDTEAVVPETVNDGDELILLVPKGQAVEMDIEISQWSEKVIKTDVNLVTPDTTAPCSEPPQPPIEDIQTELQLEAKPEEELPTKDLDRWPSPPAPVGTEEAEAEEQKMELEDLEEDEGVFSTLRSFTPLEDLSGLHTEDVALETEDVEPKTEMQKMAHVPETDMNKEDVEIELHREDVTSETEDVEPKTEMQKVAHVPETDMNKEDVEIELHREDVTSETEDAEPKTEMHTVAHVPETDMNKEKVGPEIELHREDIRQKMELHREVAEGPEVTAEELEYEIISKLEAREMAEPEMERVAEEPRPESGEELIEADYDIIDAEEERQARAAAELQGMDWFCLSCGCLLPEEGCVSGQHQDHQVTSVDRAYDDIKERLSEWISELQGRSENIEDLVSELELAYNSVEDQCAESEEAMQAQNEEMMALVMEQYNIMSLSMEEEKKAKLEQLYDQIVSFQEGIDSAKGSLETAAREAETDARVSDTGPPKPATLKDQLKAALESAMSLELGPRGLLVFEDYAKGNVSNSHLAQRKGIPVPQKPTLQPQEQGSATSTSVTVYWRVNPGDIIDCFQVYCMEDPQGAVSEEYRVTVKESYCVLEELEPDKTYKVWVMAVNYTGCSLPSERLAFRTAPSVPVIDTERCSVLWDSATLRWSSAKQTAGQSYTLEYCRQYELEGEGLRSISGIVGGEQKVLLQPNENYLFYIKAVNEAGASEQSEAALISTKGSRFHLLKASAHPSLELSEDQTTLHYAQDTHDDTPPTDNQCPSILGELLPARGHYYWETIVTEGSAYRLGVAYGTVNRNSPLGENSRSWCLHCIPTPSSCRYQLLHDDVQSDVFAMEMPERVGTLLDYQHGRLSFYNAQSGQLLGTLSHRFTQPCHPALGLEMPGSLEVSMAPEVPEFTKHS